MSDGRGKGDTSLGSSCGSVKPQHCGLAGSEALLPPTEGGSGNHYHYSASCNGVLGSKEVSSNPCSRSQQTAERRVSDSSFRRENVGKKEWMGKGWRVTGS